MVSSSGKSFPLEDIDDGTNAIVQIFTINPTANTNYYFPDANTPTAGSAAGQRYMISGTMRLVLTAQTSTISGTQTFAVACRLKGAVPTTATLADTVGVPTLTTNTNRVF